MGLPPKICREYCFRELVYDLCENYHSNSIFYMDTKVQRSKLVCPDAPSRSSLSTSLESGFFVDAARRVVKGLPPGQRAMGPDTK